MSTGIELERRVQEILTRSGFYAVCTENAKYDFNDDSVQIDVIAIWKNVCILVETTGKEDNIGPKIDRFLVRSNLLIDNHLLIPYLESLNSRHSRQIDINRFRTAEIIVRLFIATKTKLDTLKEKAQVLTTSVKVWDGDLLEYFDLLSRTITDYAKYEMLGQLNVQSDAVSRKPADLKAAHAIALPIAGGIETYTFHLDVRDLLTMSKIMRKDGWEAESFQRLVRRKKLDQIRGYLLEGHKFFPNNILVSLPHDTRFEPSEPTGRVGTLWIPNRFGSLVIIDGQHRLLAYARCNNASYSRAHGEDLERIRREDQQLQQMIDEHRLIVTGMKFPLESEKKERARLFIDINDNQTRISKSLIDALSWDVLAEKYPRAFAYCILDRLNQDGIFKDRIQVKEFQKKRIPTNSIIGFALKTLVGAKGELYAIAPDWVRNAYGRGEYEPFIDHCVTLLDEFFGKIVSAFSPRTTGVSPWSDVSKSEYMLTSVTSIVAFLRLFRHLFYWDDNLDTSRFFRSVATPPDTNPRILLNESGVQRLLHLLSDISFRRGSEFPYRGSQWGWLEVEMVKRVRNSNDYRGFGRTALLSKRWARQTGLIP